MLPSRSLQKPRSKFEGQVDLGAGLIELAGIGLFFIFGIVDFFGIGLIIAPGEADDMGAGLIIGAALDIELCANVAGATAARATAMAAERAYFMKESPQECSFT